MKKHRNPKGVTIIAPGQPQQPMRERAKKERSVKMGLTPNGFKTCSVQPLANAACLCQDVTMLVLVEAVFG